jgi:hypothetical protein
VYTFGYADLLRLVESAGYRAIRHHDAMRVSLARYEGGLSQSHDSIYLPGSGDASVAQLPKLRGLETMHARIRWLVGILFRIHSAAHRWIRRTLCVLGFRAFARAVNSAFSTVDPR